MQTSVSLDDPWKATEYTLAANQLKSDWKTKQYTWNEEKTQIVAQKQNLSIQDVIRGWLDLGETSSKAVSATTIPLLPFEMKAFKISA